MLPIFVTIITVSVVNLFLAWKVDSLEGELEKMDLRVRMLEADVRWLSLEQASPRGPFTTTGGVSDVVTATGMADSMTGTPVPDAEVPVAPHGGA